MMSKFKLSRRSKKKLIGVDEGLQSVVKRAIEITEIDFGVTEGVRSLERQQKLFDRGASKTMRSRHLTGMAVDLVAYIGTEVRWDWPLYHKLADAMKVAASELGVEIECGADWKNFPDGPHFQIKH
ncbi:MAG: M15 family metallopeptidase [Candidatus Marinimicrobia bacterium]|nr:M15 family metallopeptidase [Candidatus Neomarinimicrobiota bacterium]